jgi:hypothetical protein
MADLTYDTIDNPYGNDLNRSDNVTPPEATGVDPNAGGPSILTGQALTDAWISTFIKSTNYDPKKRGFLIDGLKGYIEAISLYISGTIVGGSIIGGSLDIPDTTSANSFHVDATGNTWWGSNTAAGYTAATASILNTGIATFGSTTGARVVLDANDAIFYDFSTGGGGIIAGDTASNIFRRTDYLSGHLEQFILQKRKSIKSNNGNVAEFFYDSLTATGAKNYIFFGRTGIPPTDVSGYTTNVTALAAKDLLQLGTSAQEEAHTAGWAAQPGSEIDIIESSWDGDGDPWVQFDPGGSRVQIAAIETTSGARYNPADPQHGGAYVGLGVQRAAGTYQRITVDNTGVWIFGSLTPEDPNAYDLGDIDRYFGNIFTGSLTIVNPVNNANYGTFDTVSLNPATTDVKFSNGIGTLFIDSASISPLVSGGASCGLNSNYWSSLYANKIYAGTSAIARLRLPVGTNMYT